MKKSPIKEKNFVLKLKEATLDGLVEDLKKIDQYSDVCPELLRYKPHIISEVEKRKKLLSKKV